MRFGVRLVLRHLSLGFSQVVGSFPNINQKANAIPVLHPLLQTSRFGGPVPLESKENASRSSPRQTKFNCVTTHLQHQ